MIDKNEAIIKYLLTCPYLAPYKSYFNFGNADDNNKQFVMRATDKSTNRHYIDGSILKIYTFDIVDFKSIGYNAIIKQEGYPDENVTDIDEVQQILDWIDEQEDLHNYPDFGPTCEIQSIRATSNEPNLNNIDTSVTPALAVYKVTVNIEYLDTSKCLWNN